MIDNKMVQKDYEFVLPIGTVITGDVMPNSNGEHYQYHIEEVLGQGGFGITYKVWSIVRNGRISTKVQFAIKEHFVKGRCHRANDGVTVEYSREAAKDVEDSLKDFVKEGRLLQSICQVKNPNDPKNVGYQHIVPVNEVIEANNTAYFVMQFLDGNSLRDMVRNSGTPMGEGEVLSLMTPISQAVEYIHHHGILHMDIKPENIVMRRNLETNLEEPVLIDFGVSLHFDKKGSLTTTHTSFGRTEGYSPIEQYGEISSFQPKIDVYALGATMFYLLSGKVPPSAFNVTQDYIEKNLPATVSKRTRKAILHAMNRDAHNRTESAVAFMSELENSFTLPVGYVLHSPNCDYLITRIHEVQESFIKYDATIHAGSEHRANDSNMTVTNLYDVYECYRKTVCKRNEDGSVSIAGKSEIPSELHTRFFPKAIRVTGLKSIGDYEMSDGRIVCELFNRYGTLYAIVDKKYKPAGFWKNCIKKLKRIIKKTLRQIKTFLKRLLFKWTKKRTMSVALIAILCALFYTVRMGLWSSFTNSETDNVDADSVEVVDTAVVGFRFESAIGECIYTGFSDDEGKPHDERGEAVFSDGRFYRGPFVHGVLDGDNAYFNYIRKTEHDTIIDTFEGSFKNNLFYKGRYTIGNGDKSKKNKDGTYIGGNYFMGTFKNGEPSVGTWYTKTNKIEKQLK